jgi:hypothetical protein
MKSVVKDSAGRGACNWCTPVSTAQAVFPNASRNIWARSTYSPEVGADADLRVAQLLRMLAERLKAQHRAGSRARACLGLRCLKKKTFSGKYLSSTVGKHATAHPNEGPKRCRFEHAPVIHARNAARLVRQHRLDRGPFKIGEFIAHDSRLQFVSLNHEQGDSINLQNPDAVNAATIV